MKIIKLILFVSILSVSPVYAQLLNLDNIKNNIIEYHLSGQYDYDLTQVAQKAKKYLTVRIRSNKQSAHPKKLAIVFDIDETVLSNFQNIKNLQFGGTRKEQNLAEDRGNDPVIKPSLDLYRYAIKNNVAVFFITGRHEHSRQNTVINLKQAGITHWTHLYMESDQYNANSAIPYKTSRRKMIAQQGYDIVANIGDQYSDLAGGYSDTVYKYPNYMYAIS